MLESFQMNIIFFPFGAVRTAWNPDPLLPGSESGYEEQNCHKNWLLSKPKLNFSSRSKIYAKRTVVDDCFVPKSIICKIWIRILAWTKMKWIALFYLMLFLVEWTRVFILINQEITCKNSMIICLEHYIL